MYAPLGHTLGHDALIHCTELHQSDTFLNQLRLGQWIHLGSLRLPEREWFIFNYIYYWIAIIYPFTYIMFASFPYCHVVQNNTCVENISNHLFFRNWIDLDRMSNFFTTCPKAHSLSFLTASWYVANILSSDPGIASETVETKIGHLG